MEVPAAQAPAGPTIGDLPPALLGRIMSLTGRAAEIGRTVTLVSHAWRDIFYSEPELWSYFWLSRHTLPPMLMKMPAPPWLAAKVALLRRVAPLVTFLGIRHVDRLEEEARYSTSPCSAAELFELAHPATLRRIDLSYWSAMPPGLLARFPNLHSLRLFRCGCDQQGSWSAAVLPAVRNMQQLTELALNVPNHPPELLADLADSLPQLRRLALSSDQPLQHAGRLTRLTALQHLSLSELSMAGACLQPPVPAQLPCLEAYQFNAGQERGAAHALRLPGGRFASAQCGDVCLWRGIDRNVSELWLTLEQLSSLPALLEGLMPPAARPDWALTLEGQLEAPPAAVALPSTGAAAQRLAGLEQLCLFPASQDASMAALLQAMVPYTTQQLTCLKVKGRIGPQLPPCVAQLTALRHLVLHNCGLSQLPGGPFLAQLEKLNLTANHLTALPAPLPITLTKLLLGSNTQLVLNEADVDCLLALPRLVHLVASGTATPPDVLTRLYERPDCYYH